MLEPILSEDYWRDRLAEAKKRGEIHRAVFICSISEWLAVERAHRRIIASHVLPAQGVLDVACGYGGLLECMPPEWFGSYYGVDLSPDLVAEAKVRYPTRRFAVADLRQPLKAPRHSWAIARSLRGMVRRELGNSTWELMLANIREVCDRILVLEYDPKDPGEAL